MPSYAMKVILNDNSDRRVPSRCSGSFDDYVVEEPVMDGSMQFNGPQNGPAFGQGGGRMGMFRYITQYKPLLSQDMRPELIGTTWYYPQRTIVVNNQGTNSSGQMKGQMKTSKQEQKKSKNMSKRYLREAADYYTQNTLGSEPNKAYPAGFKL